MKHLPHKLIITGLIAIGIVIFFTVSQYTHADTQTFAPEVDITSVILEQKSNNQTTYTTSDDLPKHTMGVTWHWKTKSHQDNINLEYRLAKEGDWTEWMKVEDESASTGMPSDEKYSDLFVYEDADKIEYKVSLKSIDNDDLELIKYISVVVPDRPTIDPSKTITASTIPTIIPRSTWMAGHSPSQPYDSPNWPPDYPDTNLVQTVVVHHTAGATTRPSNPAAVIYAIWYDHTFNRTYTVDGVTYVGWGDIGYHYLVDQYGNIYQGRWGENSVIGGHANPYNADYVNQTSSVGISVLGNYEVSGTYLTSASKDAIANVAAWKAARNGFHPEGSAFFVDNDYPRIIGHRDVSATACPGANIYSRLPEIRSLAGSKTYEFIERIHPNGTVMRVGGGRTVYVIKNGLRSAFTHSETFASHHLPYIVAVSNDDVDNYEAGPQMGFRDGVLVRASTNPTVFLIANDQRNPFTSSTVFRELGYSFDDVIVTDQYAVNLNAYGSKIDRSDIHPNGAVIRGSGLTVYLIDNGLRRAFTSSQVFKTWFDWSDVISVSDAELALYTGGSQMTFNDGVLLQNVEAVIPEDEENPVYIVSDQVYRPFADHMRFTLYSFLWNNVMKVGDKEFTLTTIGEPVTIEIPAI
ncbi:peptidoglycan recognition family protein [Patescibacteria group bacterium]